MRKNRIREQLNAGAPTLGTRIHSTWPSIVEEVGRSGLYDYVEVVAENAPFGLDDLDNLCRAAELYDLSTMIKLEQPSYPFFAQRAVGAGFSSVLFTDCRSAHDVRTCLHSIRPDTPMDLGCYGAVNRRNSYPDDAGSAAYVQGLRDTVAVFMIEKQGAVDELEEILCIPGVDMIQWGPSDFSMNIGHPGERSHPSVLAAKKSVFDTAMRMGKAVRAEIQSIDEAREYLDMGVRHFSLGTDMRILHNWWKHNGELLRASMADALTGKSFVAG